METPSYRRELFLTDLANDEPFTGNDTSTAQFDGEARLWNYSSNHHDPVILTFDSNSSTCQSRCTFVPPIDERSTEDTPLNSTDFVSSSLHADTKHQENQPSTGANKTEVLGKRHDVKGAATKKCEVCGDVAKSNHFGGLSCNSCKAFFRRSVQKDIHLTFLCCRGKKKCVITKSNRKSCQYCRMKKCFEIGMEKRWVLTEDERKALMKARTEKRLNTLLNYDILEASVTDKSQQSNCSSSENATVYVPQVERIGDHLSQLESKEIQLIVSKYEQAYQQVPYRQELRSFNNNRPGVQVTEMFVTLIKRFALYARTITHFTCLSNHDQRILLKNGVLEMCLLRGAFAFDLESNQWPNTNIPMYKDSPILSLDELRKMVSPLVLEKHVRFIRLVQQLGVDEAMIMLLTLVVLFTNRPGLSRCVERSQAFYTSLLRRYTSWRFGPERSLNVFGKLLTKLGDLRELSENHNERTLCFESDEILSIQNELKDLKISPFPEYNVLSENLSAQHIQQADIPYHSSSDRSEQSGETLSAYISSFEPNLDVDVKPARHSEAAAALCRDQPPHSLRFLDQKNPIRDTQAAELSSSNELHFIDSILQSIDQLISESMHESHSQITPSDSQSSEFLDAQSCPLSLDADIYEPSFELSGPTGES